MWRNHHHQETCCIVVDIAVAVRVTGIGKGMKSSSTDLFVSSNDDANREPPTLRVLLRFLLRVLLRADEGGRGRVQEPCAGGARRGDGRGEVARDGTGSPQRRGRHHLLWWASSGVAGVGGLSSGYAPSQKGKIRITGRFSQRRNVSLLQTHKKK